MRTKPLALIVAFACLLLAGCKQDAEVKTALTDFDSYPIRLPMNWSSGLNPLQTLRPASMMRRSILIRRKPR